MDQIDEKLVAVLGQDARASISELAAALNLSRATVRARMARLKSSGEVLGYSVVLKNAAFETPVRWLTLIAIEGRGTERVIGRLSSILEVTAIHTTSGKWDLIVETGTRTLAELDDVLRRVRLIDGIARSETNLLMATRKATRLKPPL